MSRPDHSLALVDLDHAPLDEHRTLVRVLARPGDRGADGSAAQLLVSRADAPWLSFPARVWEADRAGVWHGVFAVPTAVVARAEFGFALIVGGEAIDLPHPGFGTVAAPAAAILAAQPTIPAVMPGSGRIGGAALRTRAIALATVMAVTASSSPALALAGSAVGSTPAHSSRERIEHLGLFAVERARAIAMRRALRAAARSARSRRAKRGGLTGASTLQGAATPLVPASTLSAQTTTGTTTTTTTSSTPAASPAAATVTTGSPVTTTTTTTSSAPTTTTTTSASATATPPAPRPAHSGSERVSHPHPQLPVSLPRGTHPANGTVGLGRAGAGAAAGSLTANPPGFSGPSSWTGSVVANPKLEGVLGNLSSELRDIANPPRFLVPIYMEAARRYGVPWQVLAAINSVETDYGRNLNTSSAGAIGWMQFEPSTWKEWGVAADGHSVANPYDPRDAIFSAARYLHAAGADTDLAKGIFAYNHAGWYVDMVMARARAIAESVQPHIQANPRGVLSTFFAQVRGQWAQRFRGGYLTHYTRLISAANMVSAADFPYAWGGGHEQPARFAPFDCSGSVSYVLQQAGYTVPTTVSGRVPSWHFPSGPGRVTIFYNSTHTFMRIGNRYFGTSTSRPGGGAGWISTDRLPASYLANFSEVHVPHLGDDAFAPPSHRPRTHRSASSATGSHRATLISARTIASTPRLTRLPAFGARMLLSFPGA